MEKNKWMILWLAILLLCGLVTSCKGNNDISPPVDTPTSNVPRPTLNPSDGVSNDPSVPDITNSNATEENVATTTQPERTLPPLDWSHINFPDLDGFEKTVVMEAAMVLYSNGPVSVLLQYQAATQEQLDDLEKGEGPALDQLMESLLHNSSIVSSKMIDLPGLNCQGLEMELSLVEEFYYKGLVIPSSGQVLVLVASAPSADAQALQSAYSQLIQLLTV